MPFNTAQPLDNFGTVGIAVHDEPDPSFMDTVGAAFRQENIVASTLTRAGNFMEQSDRDAIDPNYDVFKDLVGYEDQADRFVEVFNPSHAAALKSQIDMERKDRDILAASGWTGTAVSMGASIVDLPTLIPGGALVRGGNIGYSALRSALAVGAAAGVGTAVQEAGLQATQEMRTARETALNIGGSVILGGLIGGAAGKFFSNEEWARVSKQLESDLTDIVPNPDEVTQTIVTRMQSAGAAAVDEVNLDDLGIGGPKAAELVARATAAARINPGIETLFSPSTKVRETYVGMVDNPVYTKMNMRGESLGADAENIVKMYTRGATADWVSNNKALYKQARKAGYQGKQVDFNRAIAFAARRGDIDPNGDEFITKAAQATRSKIFDPLLKEAISLKLLPEDVKVNTALTYVTRLWNRQRLIGEEARFREIASGYFGEQIAKLPEGAGPDLLSKADLDDYVDEVVTSVFNNLTGRGDGEFAEWMVPVKRGPLKERTFNIPDELVEEFLENDMEAIVRNYTRKMSAEVELTRRFGRADMKDQLEAIRVEYSELSKAAATPEERLKLDRAMKRDMTNLTAFRDMIRGTYRAGVEGSDWSKITRAALTWNYVRLLGGQLLASITDASRVVGGHPLGDNEVNVAAGKAGSDLHFTGGTVHLLEVALPDRELRAVPEDASFLTLLRQVVAGFGVREGPVHKIGKFDVKDRQFGRRRGDRVVDDRPFAFIHGRRHTGQTAVHDVFKGHILKHQLSPSFQQGFRRRSFRR